MNFIALFFLCVRMFHFIHSHRIAYLLQRFSRILDERRANPGRKQVIIIDGSATTFIIYFLLDVFFLLYCIWLMLHDTTWTPGFSAARDCSFGIARYSRPHQRCL